MKKLAVLVSLAFSTVTFAGDLPLPQNVATIENPSLKGLPFLAAEANDYYMQDNSGDDVIPVIEKNASNLCAYAGFTKFIYTYEVEFLKDDSSNVVVFTKPYTTHSVKTSSIPMGEGEKTYYGSVFKSVTCYKNY